MEDILGYIRRAQAEDRASLDELNSNGQRSNQAPNVTQQGPRMAFTISKELVLGCTAPGCSRIMTGGLSRCTGCRAALYCGREHQHVDRPAHKSACSKIRKANVAYQEAERQLRDEEGDAIFTEGPPHFWGIHETRPYMRARFTLVESLLLVNTETAVNAALDHLLAMLQLCRSDNMGVRDVVPALFLRLRKDQQAYDFCKWWVTTGQEGDYDWGDKTSPYLATKQADVFEDPREFVRNATISLSFAVSVTLVKIRLLMDLLALQRDRQIAAPKLPSEITDQGFVHCTSAIIQRQRQELEREEQTLNITMLRKHVEQLFTAVKESNKHFWPALVRPGSHLEARPMMHGFGDIGQMQVVLRANYNAWAETEGAIGVIEELLQS
ncbi:hypothetical protein EKO04_000413 [Ascochyta lentis]|uniref:MYND-type domain-containing protein n=1 Tax=Ascochyta lentis TaxID=205686 RepID=A0A8H7JET7_9PLEO|nr:hypothetical protein EKO04_000413 [Ascochyta lentis]